MGNGEWRMGNGEWGMGNWLLVVRSNKQQITNNFFLVVNCQLSTIKISKNEFEIRSSQC
jgi:hypothetical protein